MDLPDHRRLGRQLNIFATEEQCGSGLPFWLPAGAIIRQELERFVSGLSRVRQMTLNDGQVFCEPDQVADEIADILSMDQRPIIVHRSVISTMGRMVAHLLEIHNGALPAWLSPTQVLVLPAGADSRDYATIVSSRLANQGLRAELDERDSTLGARIRSAQQRKVPYLAVVGEREQRAQTISIRLRSGEQLAPVPIEQFAAMTRQAGSR